MVHLHIVVAERLGQRDHRDTGRIDRAKEIIFAGSAIERAIGNRSRTREAKRRAVLVKYFELDGPVRVPVSPNNADMGRECAEDLFIEQYRIAQVTRWDCLLYTSPSPRDGIGSRMPSSG